MIRRILLTLVLVVPVAGCVMPPAVSLASFALDGVSAATTGKTVGDHALSIAAQQDCALWRLLDGEPICHDFPPGKTPKLVAEAAAWAAGDEVVGLGDVPVPVSERTPPRTLALASHPIVVPPESVRATPAPREIAAADWRPRVIPAGFVAAAGRDRGAAPEARWAMPITATPPVGPPMPPPEVLDVAPAAGPAAPAAEASDPAARQVVVIGSFRRIANARRVAEHWADLSASIVSLEVAGIRFYRVVTAPTDPAGIAEQKRRLFTGGVEGAVWVAPLCGEGPRRPRCVALPAAARSWRP